MKPFSIVQIASIAIAIFMQPTAGWAQAVHGTFRVVKGQVKVIRGSDGKEVPAKIGQKVVAKDVIIAGADSRAKIVMVDKNELNVSPDSKIEIQNYEYKPNEDKKNVLLNVIYGKVRAKVNQKYDGDNSFQVKTPSAVAGVRGTDFFTSYNRSSNETKVVTFEGRVAFGQPGANGRILNPVMVAVGQTTSIVGNAPPAAPVSVPKTELTQMEQQSDATKASDSPSDSRQPADTGSGDNKKKSKDPNNSKSARDGDGAGAGAPTGDSAEGSASNEKKSDSNSSGDKKAEGNSAAPQAGNGPGEPSGGKTQQRAPSSVPSTPAAPSARPVAGGGSMLLPGDLAGAPNPSVPPVLPTLGPLPIGPGLLPPLPTTYNPVNEIIGSTNKRLLINVKTPTSP